MVMMMITNEGRGAGGWAVWIDDVDGDDSDDTAEQKFVLKEFSVNY